MPRIARALRNEPGLNRENLKSLIDLIAGVHDKNFNMTHFFSGDWSVDMIDKDSLQSLDHSCDTAACIGGYGLLLMTVEDKERKNIPGLDGHWIAREVGVWLGLRQESWKELFGMNMSYGQRMKISRAEALKVLRHLLKYGLVTWYQGNRMLQRSQLGR